MNKSLVIVLCLMFVVALVHSEGGHRVKRYLIPPPPRQQPNVPSTPNPPNPPKETKVSLTNYSNYRISE
ncbi:UNVERIFIED_CONTAM: hypothetical protein PYX00_006493 [Menopon gallinae]|uniref:Uncharacterized protein n=1 Tax=Menopon gallinae TaxID=328185 RepID=A0AAW2HX22_9NEOP